jgi:hypothetical protein
VEPLAALDVKLPGVMLMLAAPDVAQLKVLLDPALMVAGLAVNEPMLGLPPVFTVTVVVDVIEPAPFVAVSV